MNRRDAIGAVLATLVVSPGALPIPAYGQTRIRRVVLITGSNERTLSEPLNAFRERMKELGAPALGVEGGRNAEWMLVDLGDIVVHLMHPAVRDYYNLEEIWGGKQVRLKTGGPAVRRRTRR